MTSYEMVGKIKLVKDLMTFASGFTKREFVLETEDGNYPQNISFSCLKDNTALLNSFQAGDQVKVTFSIRGHEYNQRYFNDLVAFRIAKVDADGSTVEYDQGAAPAAQTAPAVAHAASSGSGPDDDAAPADDDIPF